MKKNCTIIMVIFYSNMKYANTLIKIMYILIQMFFFNVRLTVKKNKNDTLQRVK